MKIIILAVFLCVGGCAWADTQGSDYSQPGSNPQSWQGQPLGQPGPCSGGSLNC